MVFSTGEERRQVMSTKMGIWRGALACAAILLAVGSAYASLVTQFFIAIIEVIIVQKIFKFKINYRYLFTLLFFVIGVILLNFISKAVDLRQLGIGTSGNSWLVNFFLMIILSVGFAAALKLLNLKSMLQILREDR